MKKKPSHLGVVLLGVKEEDADSGGEDPRDDGDPAGRNEGNSSAPSVCTDTSYVRGTRRCCAAATSC